MELPIILSSVFALSDPILSEEGGDEGRWIKINTCLIHKIYIIIVLR